ncbi:leucyl aminopeptidase [Elusimicrobiota bacterium]
MTINCIDRSNFKGEKDTLVLFAWEGEKIDAGGWLDSKKQKSLEETLKKEGFKGKEGETFLHLPETGDPCARIILAGLGKKKEAAASTLRNAAGSCVKVSKKQSEHIWVDLPKWPEKISNAQLSQAAAEGLLLASYAFTKHKSKDEESKKEQILKRASVIVEKPEDTGHCANGIKKAEALADAVVFARDLVNEPSMNKHPADIAKIAKTMANKQIIVRVYNRKELERMKMNALLGVGQGSSHDPYFIHITYKPKGGHGNSRKKIGLVGKGVTFDSGGLCIKTSNQMREMKSDMAGAATVLATLRACPKLNIGFEVQGFVPLAENMPGCNAYKVGDVLKAYNGKTIEVLNTDAEGRLILADALSFATKQNPDTLIDVATLTGGIVVALGDEITGLFSNNESLLQDIKKAAALAGENIWHMPLAKNYKSRIKSPVADISNMPTRPNSPSATIAGLFLEEFVDSKNWAHLDIAGSAWTDTETPICPTVGGTGAITRTLLEYLLQ